MLGHFKPNPPPYLNKAGKNARQVQKKGNASPNIKGKARRKGREMRRGRKTLSEIEILFVFHRKDEEGRGWPVRVILREHAFSTAVV